jgi:hypothetical protein
MPTVPGGNATFFLKVNANNACFYFACLLQNIDFALFEMARGRILAAVSHAARYYRMYTF